MTRREMREHCFKMFFGAIFYPPDEAAAQAEQYFASPEEEEDTAQDGTVEIIHRVDMSETDRAFLISRVEGMVGKIPELDGKLDAVAQGWKTRRMGRVELTILRQALYEMAYDSEVPDKVAINEAVELAKRFGGKDSAAFVNGVLAKMVRKDDSPSERLQRE